MPVIYRPFLEKLGGETSATTYVGNSGELFYDPATTTLRISDGSTPGGSVVSGGGGGGLPLSNGDSSIDIPVASANVEITVDDGYIWSFDVNGDLTIPSNILGSGTIRIDNTATGNTADIQLWAADDIVLQARDRDINSSSSEGGDINLFAGDGRPGSNDDDSSSGGDIQIFGGIGGAAGDFDSASAGGFIGIRAGDGGTASAADSRAAGGGGTIFITGGNAGPADGVDALGAIGGGITITAGDSTGNGTMGGSVAIYAGSGGPNASAGEVEINVPNSPAGPGGIWSFDYTGTFTVPAAIQLASYIDTTARDNAITSPAPGMLIYVDGVGLQVFGATTWNTVGGTT